MMGKYEELADFIIEHVGGEANIQSLQHCMTRLRFILKEEAKAETEKLKGHQGILSVVKGNGQYQIVIGTQVKHVYEAIGERIPRLEAATNKEEPKKNSKLSQFADMLSKIFSPILPVLGATGMIKGILVLLTTLGWMDKASGTYQLLFIIGDSLIYYLPIYLGYTTAKYFKSNLFIGMVIGACLVHPNVLTMMKGDVLEVLFTGSVIESKVYASFLSIPVLLMNYTSSAIPAIAAVYFAGKVEKYAKRGVPELLHTFLVPLITLVIAVPATFIVLGPIATWAGNILGQVTLAIYKISPVIAGGVIGALWEFCIMFGMHRSFTPITLNNIATLGYDQVMAARFAFPLVVTGVLLATVLKAKKAEEKSGVLPTFISSFFGITEPGLYGVILTNIRLMIITSLSTGLAGALMGLFGSRYYVLGGGGIFVFPSYINPEGFDTRSAGAMIALAAGFAAAFILTFFFGRSKNSALCGKEENKQEMEAASALKQMIIPSPLTGDLVALSEVQDEVFSKGIIGKGIAVYPREGKIMAPAKGVVKAIFPGGHAIGITTDSGVELLIHIGLETVNLKGEGFISHIQQGDVIKEGQLLVEFDVQCLAEKGFDMTTILIVTNTAQYLDILPLQEAGTIEVGKPLLSVVQ